MVMVKFEKGGMKKVEGQEMENGGDPMAPPAIAGFKKKCKPPTQHSRIKNWAKE